MSRKTKRFVPLTRVIERAGNNDKEANAAWDRYRAIEQAGGLPEIYYSDFNGYQVIDKLAMPPKQRN